MARKTWLLGAIASVALFVAAIGIQPASWGLWYQPKHPSLK